MKKILLASILVLGVGVSAQVTGTKTIGTDYPTLADAFTDLNTNGVGSGGVTLNLPAGYTETIPVGGLKLGSSVLNATLSSSNPLIIQKSGTGANPIFSASAGTSTTTDAFFKFAGVDYVTVDGVTLQEVESNTTPTTKIERGFYFYNLSATDGTNYNTVKNSTINFLPGSTVVTATSGIYFAHTNETGTALNPTSTEGLNSYNKIYGNTINNPLSIGVYFGGFASAAPYTLRDTNNDIGGTSASTGNTITNIGEIAYITAYGYFGTYQAGANISNNTMTFASGGLGAAGIYVYGDNTTFTVNSNNVSAPSRQTYYVSASSLSTHAGIYCLSVSASTAVNLIANNNTFNFGTSALYTGASVPPVYGILHAYAATANTGSLTATGNNIQGPSVGTYYGIYSTVSGPSITVTDNTIHDVTTSSSVAASAAYGVFLGATGVATNVLKNKIYGLQSNGTAGIVYGINVGGSTASTTTNIVNNLVGDLRTPSASSTSPLLAGINLVSTGATSKLNVYYNSIYLNATSSGANFNSTGILHTYNTNATTATLDLKNNIISNTSTPNGTGYASALRRTSATNLNNYATTSNNNDFAVGSATNSVVYYNGTTGYNYADFLTHVTTREANSLNIKPEFAAINGADANFLKLNVSATSTQNLDNKGAADILDFTTDYAGVTRNSTTPDIGAYEFTYVAPTTAPSCTTISTPITGATGVTPNPANLSWSAASGATSYKVYVGTTAGGTDVVNGTSTSALNYSASLQPNKIYYARVIASNNIGDATGCTEISFTTGNYVYCTAGSGNGTFERSTNVKIAEQGSSTAILDNNSTGTTGYENFTATPVDVTLEKTYTLTVTVTNGYASDAVYAWVDLNQDGTLDDTTEKTVLTYTYSGSSTTPSTATGNISIPSTAVIGNTRLRIRVNDTTGTISNTTSCGVGSYGEVEDYTLNIKSPTQAVSDVNKTNISVYPNPFTDVLKVSDVKGVKSISVNDISGRQVKTLTPSAEINLSNLRQGLYIVNLQMEDGSIKSFKAIKK